MYVTLDPIIPEVAFEEALAAEVEAWFDRVVFKPLVAVFDEARENAFDPSQRRDKVGKWAKTGLVNWDARGVGTTPYQVDIDYFGFTKPMTPREFRLLVPPGVSGPKTKAFIEEEIKKGTPICPPYLRVKWDEERKAWRVLDHEGRSRSDAAPMGVAMPVSIKPEGMRARDLTPEMRAAPFIPQEWYGDVDVERTNAAIAFANLLSALKSGKVNYANGVFAGSFSSKISRELRSLGAKFNANDKTFRVDPGAIPYGLRGAIADARMRSDALHKAIADKAAEIGSGVAAAPSLGIDLGAFANKLVRDLEKQFQRSLRAAEKATPALETVTVAPDFSPTMIADVRETLTENLELSIKNFTEEEVLEIRALAEENWMAGGRVDLLQAIIQERYGVSERKAAFLGRQETSMVASEYARARAQEIGSTEYVWHCRHDDRVRPDHQELNGTTQMWDSPPVVDKAHDRRANPGMDWNCRCVARPLLNLAVRRVA